MGHFQNRRSQSCEEVFHSFFLLDQWTCGLVENMIFGSAEGFLWDRRRVLHSRRFEQALWGAERRVASRPI